jgi:hypothetical protein
MKTSIFLCALGIAMGSSAAEPTFNTAEIEKLTGLKGTYFESENVFKVSLPRSDVKVAVDGWQMPPFMGLTSWAAFTEGTKAKAMVMGDLVLMEDEVNPVMSAALGAGLTVTALHNHFFFDVPKIYFMHIGGEGTPEKLATGVRAAFDTIKQIRAASLDVTQNFGKPFAPGKNAIDGGPIDTIFGSKGQANDGMFKVVIGRTAEMDCGCTVGKEMGVNTWAGFAGTNEDAVVDGDFAVLESELQPVLASLRKSGINIVAIHQHMTGESPRIIFLHYWGRGAARELAQGVRTALDKTSK